MKSENVDLAYMVNFEMLGITLSSGKNQVYMTGYKLSDMAEKMNAVYPVFVQFLPLAKKYNLFEDLITMLSMKHLRFQRKPYQPLILKITTTTTRQVMKLRKWTLNT